MEKSSLESLLFVPMKLVDSIDMAIKEVDSNKQECSDLHSHVLAFAQCLRTMVVYVKRGNSRFSERPTKRVVEDACKALEKCLVLVRRCKRLGFLRRVLTIITAADFKSVSNALKDAIANVEWLLNVATDDDPTGMHGMPPIVSAQPNLAPVWAIIANLEGGTMELREGAVSSLVSFISGTEQIGGFFLEENGIPELLKLFRDGSIDAQINAATVLGNLAINQQRVQRMSHDKVVPVLVHVLERGSMVVQAKVAWAIAEMVSQDEEMKIQFGEGHAIKHLIALMLETMDNMLPILLPIKTVSIHSVLNASMQAGLYKANTCQEETSSSISNESERGIGPDGTLPSGRHMRHASDSPLDLLKVRDTYHRERERQPAEIKKDLQLQVTRALWFLAEKNIENSRRITETIGVLALAKLIEKEQGEVQKHAIMVVLHITKAAEIDTNLRKSAFKKTSAASKAVVDQLLRVIDDSLEELDIQCWCITALGCLARSFSAMASNVIRCIVRKLVIKDDRYIPIARAAISTLLKFTDDENFLHLEHSKTIVESLALPLVVQLAVSDTKTPIALSAILLLCRLCLYANSTMEDAFKEAGTLSVLKSIASSSSTMKRFSQFCEEEIVLRAIHHLEFGWARDDPLTQKV